MISPAVTSPGAHASFFSRAHLLRGDAVKRRCRYVEAMKNENPTGTKSGESEQIELVQLLARCARVRRLLVVPLSYGDASKAKRGPARP